MKALAIRPRYLNRHWKMQVLVDEMPAVGTIPMQRKIVQVGGMGQVGAEQARIIAHPQKPDEIRDFDVHAQTAYWGEKNGYVSFFLHDPKNERGFGGRAFTANIDGETIRVKGPWSSSNTAMERFGFPPSVHVSMTDDPMVMVKGYTFFSAHVTLDWAVEAVDRLLGHDPFGHKMPEPLWIIKNGELYCPGCNNTGRHPSGGAHQNCIQWVKDQRWSHERWHWQEAMGEEVMI